jgi:hypothetical protein
MSASTPSVCTCCLCLWTSSRYCTCDNCRARSRVRHQHQHHQRQNQTQPDLPNYSVAPVSADAQSLDSSSPQSTQTGGWVCTSCLQPWTPSRYFTYNNCRAQSRVRYRRQRHHLQGQEQPNPPNRSVVPVPTDDQSIDSNSQQFTQIGGWVCTSCLQLWYSSRYYTCDNCREQNRTYYIQQVSGNQCNLISKKKSLLTFL